MLVIECGGQRGSEKGTGKRAPHARESERKKSGRAVAIVVSSMRRSIYAIVVVDCCSSAHSREKNAMHPKKRKKIVHNAAESLHTTRESNDRIASAGLWILAICSCKLANTRCIWQRDGQIGGMMPCSKKKVQEACRRMRFARH